MKIRKFAAIHLAAFFVLVLAATSPALHAQTYTVLYNFGFESCDPEGPAHVGLITQGRDGDFYTTAPFGGCVTNGAAYKFSPDGTPTVLHSFNNANGDGVEPSSGLTLGTSGQFWGTSSGGGDNQGGNIFTVSSTGTFDILYSFCAETNCTDGGTPIAPPVQGMNGDFYGMTVDKGNLSICTYGNGGCGTIYKITPAGQYSVLHTFDQTNGANPMDQLVLGTDGNFYGTTFYGGSVNGVYNGNGVFFRITPSGAYTPVYTFCSLSGCLDGGQPTAGLVQGTDGNFYGTTICCGTHLYSNYFGGTIFKITPTGKLTVLYNFCSQPNCADGGEASAGLIQGTDGNFYGTAVAGGETGNGTIFQITPEGVYTVLHSFDYTDGNVANSLLTQGTDGTIYGQTAAGGTGPCINTGCGVIFSLDMGLSDYADPLTWYGDEGATIEILGSGLTGTTEVTFDAISATFKVLNSNYLTAVVPSGAGLGTIKITTPKGVLSSRTNFHVLPHITSFTPTSGAVGTLVTINGTGFNQTTAVHFGNTVTSKFTVVSDIEITATVPTGAKTGPITVITKSGSAPSSKTFTLTP